MEVEIYPNFRRHFRTILRFTKEETEVRKQALPFVPAHHIRILDAISEVICVLLSRMIKKELAFVSVRYTMVSKSYVHRHYFFKKTKNRVKFETTVETNIKSISRQTTMVFDNLHQTILIRFVQVANNITVYVVPHFHNLFF